jgi:NitT/TauT family transport system substrate-binding protein
MSRLHVAPRIEFSRKIQASMMPLRRVVQILAFTALAVAALFTAQPARAAEKTTFNVAWSIYVGWMPWDYANQSGILKKWADKYGIKIELTQINDYVESINQYTAASSTAA